MYDITKLIHLMAGILWLGGMAFMLLALRPAAVAVLQPPERLQLMAAVMGRFFKVVGASIVALLATGPHLYVTAFRAARQASDQGSVPLGWNLMAAIGLLMVLVFGHLFFVGYARFKRAVAAKDWPLAGQAAVLIHRLVVSNFVLGCLALVCVRLIH
jgi:uncharacterized membrane protein